MGNIELALIDLVAVGDDLGRVVLADFRDIIRGILVLLFLIVVFEAGDFGNIDI